jgi:hypothetical protein
MALLKTILDKVYAMLAEPDNKYNKPHVKAHWKCRNQTRYTKAGRSGFQTGRTIMRTVRFSAVTVMSG